MKELIFLHIVLFISLFLGCHKDYEETKVDLSQYQIEEGFKIEVIAAEPLIEAPVAMEFDAQGRLWVLELPGYMSNINGEGENDPIGRILILEDRDGDGQMDHAKPFLENLKAARTFAHAYGGIIYAEPPNLFWVENKNDQPGEKILIDSTYVVGGNIEHQPNSITRNIDNWWYNAKSQFRYRRINGEWKKEVTSFRGQWGLTKDNYGRLFYNDNSNPLFGDFIRPNLFLKNKHHRPQEGISKVIAPDRRVYPLHATAINRGYIDGTLDEDGKVKTFTSACGPLIYRGINFPKEYDGNAFVCGPEVNLVKRYNLKNEGNKIISENPYPEKEFLASTDEGFRPVNLYNAPDGSMYIVDFHRGIIQHKVYMTAYLREETIERGLDSVVNYGRILKVASKNKQNESIPNLTQLNGEQLIKLLYHKNGWLRDKAQQLIIEKELKETIPYLEKIISENKNPLAQIHAMWTLEGLDALTENTLLSVEQKGDSEVIATAIYLMEKYFGEKPLIKLIEKIKSFDDIVELQLVNSTGAHPNTFPLLVETLNRHKNDTLFYDAAVSGLKENEELFFEHLRTYINPPLEKNFQDILTTTIKNKKEGIAFFQEKNAGTFTDPKTYGLELYRNHCASCHGMDGHGINNLAPPIYHSEYIEGDPSLMISVVLHGMKGPVTVGGKKYEMNAVMPGIAVNPEMTDEKIAGLLTFIRHGFGRDPLDISEEEVKALRNVLPKDGMFTEEELMVDK